MKTQPMLRLLLAAIINVVLAVWALPHIGHSNITAWQLIAWVVLPLIAIICVVPVFVLGKPALRLIAVGLAFFPSFVLLHGLLLVCSVLSSA